MVAKLGTLAIERGKEITEAIQHSKGSLARVIRFG
jgi:hypothetical protein